jgi:hypothetical protein
VRIRPSPEGRLLLSRRPINRFLLTILLAGVLGSLAGLSLAQNTPRGESHFVGLKKSDRVGKESAYPDGKPDVVFSLKFFPRPNEPTVTDIEIRTTAGPSGRWTATGKGGAVGYLGIARSKRPSIIVNPKGGPLKLTPRVGDDLLLFVTDDGRFSRKDRRYLIKVTQSDGKSWSVPVTDEPVSQQAGTPVSAGTYPVRMSARLEGLSRYDAVNPGKTIKGDDKADGLFRLTVEAKDKEITAIQIRNADGVASVWDTVPGSKHGAIGVALRSEPARLLNHRDGSIRIKVQDRVNLNLYVADNGSIKDGNTRYRVTVNFSDGGISWSPVQRISARAETPPRPEPRREATVNFLGTWLGFVSTDAVGPYPQMKPDSEADAVFGLDIEARPEKEITGIEIHSLANPERRWGTGGTSPGNWGLAVAYQNAPRVLLNKTDGSVRIPVEKRVQLYLYAADPGDLKTSSDRLRMIVHFADGSSYQQLVRRPLASTSTVVPGTGGAPAARGLITCEFRGFIADLVNTSTRPGKDGYLDGTFIMRLKVKDKKLTKVVVRGTDGSVRWSSQAKPPVMFLGVALYPKIYKLVNSKPGPLKVPIAGRRTIYLYAADNGLLSDPNARLTVEVTFSDKTTLSTEVIK